MLRPTITALMVGSVLGCTNPDVSSVPVDESARAVIDTTEIVGITLGSPVVIPECRKETTHGLVIYAFDGLSYPCFKESLTDRLDLTIAADLPRGPKHNGYGPKIELAPASVPEGVSSTVDIMMLDGIPSEIRLTTTGVEAQERLYALLASKYGQPDASNISTMQNGMGATYGSIEATWNLPRMSVVFFGMGDSPREGFITASTPTAKSFWDARTEKRASSF